MNKIIKRLTEVTQSSLQRTECCNHFTFKSANEKIEEINFESKCVSMPINPVYRVTINNFIFSKATMGYWYISQGPRTTPRFNQPLYRDSAGSNDSFLTSLQFIRSPPQFPAQLKTLQMRFFECAVNEGIQNSLGAGRAALPKTLFKMRFALW